MVVPETRNSSVMRYERLIETDFIGQAPHMGIQIAVPDTTGLVVSPHLPDGPRQFGLAHFIVLAHGHHYEPVPAANRDDRRDHTMSIASP